MESLTASIIQETSNLLKEIENLGGMTKAVESGMPKQEIEAAAARRQALIDHNSEQHYEIVFSPGFPWSA